MQIIQKNTIPSCQLIVIPLIQNKIPKSLSEKLEPSLSKELKNLSKDLKEDKSLIQHIQYKKEKAELLILNLKSEDSLENFYETISKNILKDKKTKISIVISHLNEDQALANLIEGLHTHLYKFDKYLSEEDKKMFFPENLYFISNLAKKDFENISHESSNLSLAIDYIKNLVNTPPLDCTPNTLALEAKQIAKTSKYMKCKILDEKDILKEKLNLLYSVGAGSAENSKLIQLEYKGKGYDKTKKPILIVGKGVTFDAGGLNIKPTGYIETMKYDMGGAGAVLGLFYLLSHLELPVHVIGLIPSVENLVGNSAYKPGDVITAYNGKTVEITNTDAEGRLILADALSYGVKNFEPEAIIDLATLTGACIMALGHTHTAIISNNDKLFQKIDRAAQTSQSLIHRLPLHKLYQEKVEGDISDYKNYTGKIGAGTIMAAAFLEKFIDETPWIHLDIAGTAFLEMPLNHKPSGATGEPLKLLYTFLKQH